MNKVRAIVVLGTLLAVIPAYAAYDVTDIRSFGGRCDGVTDNTAAIQAAFRSALDTGNPLYFPAGRCKVNSPVVLDFKGKNSAGRFYSELGLTITGAGRARTIIDGNAIKGFPTVLIQNTDVASTNPADPKQHSFYLNVRDIGVEGNTAGPVFQVGLEGFSDPWNEIEVANTLVWNGSLSTTAVGCKFNYVLNSRIDMNCNTGGYGDALMLRQVSMSTISGSYSNATNGIHLRDGSNWGNTFLNPDLEMVKTAVLADSGTSWNNTFIGGQYHNNSGKFTAGGYGADFAGDSKSNLFINPNTAAPGSFWGRIPGVRAISQLISSII